MKVQNPANGILKRFESNTSKTFYITCVCGSSDDNIDMSIEFDKTFDDVTVSFETIQKTDWYKVPEFWNIYDIESEWLAGIANYIQGIYQGMYHRLKITKDVWINGYVKYYGCAILTRQQAINLSDAITSSISDLESK